MSFKQPESTEECIFYTRRTIGADEEGRITAWVFKKECPKCHKAQMGKPVVKGKKMVRAKEYVCPACGYVEEKFDHEKTLMVNIEYTCPFCKKSGEATTEYKRKTLDGVPAYIFNCGFCQKKLGITKKMKEGKAKAAVADDDDDF